jgi:hypothetical protein
LRRVREQRSDVAQEGGPSAADALRHVSGRFGDGDGFFRFRARILTTIPVICQRRRSGVPTPAMWQVER